MKQEFKFILLSFLGWRSLLLLVVFFSIKYISLQSNFLGGGMENYIKNPYLWSLANFDGEHFLSVAKMGYQPLTYFFFPAYPLLIKLLVNFSSNSLINYLYSGIFISHLSLFVGLLGFYKLINIDDKSNISKWAILSLLIFPTSFYFAAVYSESIFFALSVWSLYFARKNNFLFSGILVSLATATRVVGIALLIPILYEFLSNRAKTVNPKNIIGLLISPLGILIYMYYLNSVTGDPLNFFNTVGIFGEQRNSNLILLPQVFYRYIFKILPNISLNYFPGLFVTIMEFTIASLLTFLSIFSFNKIRMSYWIFMVLGFVIPTLSGSFSSLPRYSLVLFPMFIIFGELLSKHRVLRFVFFGVSLATLIISLALFSRGYWVS